MPSNGKEITDWLRNHFPAAKLSGPQWEYWARDLAREEWDTEEALSALQRMVQEKPPKYMPDLPVIQAAITAHHRRLAETKTARPWKEAPLTKEELAEAKETVKPVASGLFGKAPDAVMHPGWDSRDFAKLRGWRRLNNIPPPVGPVNRRERKKMSPALVEEERNLFRAISAEVKGRR